MRKRLMLISLICLSILAACNSTPAIDVASLPEGDVARGEALFDESIKGAPTCASCHYTDSKAHIGPGLLEIAEHAANRIEGVSAEEYIVESILRPSAFIVHGFGNLMYAEYRSKLSEQDIADLLAYLLGL